MSAKETKKINQDFEEDKEVMVFPLIGWNDDGEGKIKKWIFRTGMNRNWYKDGNILVEPESDLIIGFKSLRFSLN